jgi:hypothetical protein
LQLGAAAHDLSVVVEVWDFGWELLVSPVAGEVSRRKAPFFFLFFSFSFFRRRRGVGFFDRPVMVARMMRWPRQPPARDFRVRLVVRRAEGLPPPPAPLSPEGSPEAEAEVFVEVCWKGPKMSPLSSLRRAQRPPRNQTRKEALPAAGAAAAIPADVEDGAAATAAAPAPTVVAVAWEEEFERDAALTAASHREATAFQPWDISFSVVSVSISPLSFCFVFPVHLCWIKSVCELVLVTERVIFFMLTYAPLLIMIIGLMDLMFELIVTLD